MINFDELDPALAFSIGELIAKAEEHKRIINLLEKQMDDCCGYSPSECFTHSIISRSIELIKGETNE